VALKMSSKVRARGPVARLVLMENLIG
jgi:hypothetical protein